MNKRKIEYIIFVIVFLIMAFSNSLDLLFIKSDAILNAEILKTDENKNLAIENKELKEALNFYAKTDRQYIVSKVKFRDIYNFQEEITIFKGQNDGLKKGQAVMDQNGLIGVIKKVNKNSSLVRLLTNKESKISVKINNTYGILQMQDAKLVVSNITNYAEVTKDSDIYTSGIGNLPGNILIGKVKAINLDNLEIEKIIQVDLMANLSKINYVYVVGEV